MDLHRPTPKRAPIDGTYLGVITRIDGATAYLEVRDLARGFEYGPAPILEGPWSAGLLTADHVTGVTAAEATAGAHAHDVTVTAPAHSHNVTVTDAAHAHTASASAGTVTVNPTTPTSSATASSTSTTGSATSTTAGGHTHPLTVTDPGHAHGTRRPLTVGDRVAASFRDGDLIVILGRLAS